MDLISRQDAIDALGEKPLVWDDLNDFDLGKAAQWSDDVDAIKALPPEQPEYTEQDVRDAFNDGYRCGMESAQPQPMRGRWTEKTVSENPQACGIREWQSAKCSVCGKYHSTPYLYSFTEYAFCPWCGADMRNDADDELKDYNFCPTCGARCVKTNKKN